MGPGRVIETIAVFAVLMPFSANAASEPHRDGCVILKSDDPALPTGVRYYLNRAWPDTRIRAYFRASMVRVCSGRTPESRPEYYQRGPTYRDISGTCIFDESAMDPTLIGVSKKPFDVGRNVQLNRNTLGLYMQVAQRCPSQIDGGYIVTHNITGGTFKTLTEYRKGITRSPESFRQALSHAVMLGNSKTVIEDASETIGTAPQKLRLDSVSYEVRPGPTPQVYGLAFINDAHAGTTSLLGVDIIDGQVVPVEFNGFWRMQ